MGLDDSVYGAVWTAIISTDPLPNLNQAYSKVKSVERVNTVMQKREDQGAQAAFAVNVTRHVDSSEDKSKLICGNCKHKGHTRETCFEIIGYPGWWGERGGKNQRGRGRGGMIRANVAHVIGSEGQSSEAAKNGFTGLSNDQWKTLINILDTQTKGTSNRLNGKHDCLDWVLDTGASNHMTGNLNLLTDVTTILSCNVGLPNGHNVMTNQKGSVVFDVDFSLKNVLLVPELRCNLISVSQLVQDADCMMQIANIGCVIQGRLLRNLIGAGELRNGLYFFRRLKVFRALSTNKDGAEDVWHQRLGHPSNKVFDLLPVGVKRVKDFSACDVCLQAKQCRNMFHSSDNKASEVFEMIHYDVWGPYRTPSLCDAYYFLTIVDDYSRGIWVYLLHDKTKVQKQLKCFMKMVSRQFGKTIKIMRSNNGTEFTCMFAFFKENGIIHQTSCVATPQQNGRVERKHRHILNVARALLFQSKLPTKFWGEGILTAAHLINRTPSPLLDGKTPYELLYGAAPKYDDLRIFGCLAYAHNQKRGGDKFASRSRKCLFVGYPFGKRGWSLFDLETEEIFVSRDVVFAENEFPYISFASSSSSVNQILDDDWMVVESDPSPSSSKQSDHALLQPDFFFHTEAMEVENTEATPPTNCEPVLEPSLANTPSVSTTEDTNPPQSEIQVDMPLLPPSSVLLGRRQRQRQTSVKLRDYVVRTVHHDCEYPISDYLDSSRFSSSHKALLTAITRDTIPTSFNEAVLDDKWNHAMKIETIALEDTGTWDMAKLPEGKKAIGSKWVYTIKYHADGEIERYKARVVALGNRQIEGTDYSETFAPVIKMTTVRATLKVAAAHNWELH